MVKTLTIKNISKRYGKKRVITDISIDIKQGEIIGLLGPNGAGKTTCFYIVAGLIKPDSGNIFIDQLDISHMSMYQRGQLGINYLPQESSIFRGMNVEDNIYTILEITEPNIEIRKQKLEQLLSEFSIKHLRKNHALSLSGGERRRVEIARSLACNPSFILFDEPFAGIDPIAVNDIRQMIIQLKKRNIGILITDHNVRETLSIVDHGYIVYDGTILSSGDKEQIINDQKVKNVYLGEDFKYQ